jgi:hypothetical protein
MVYLKYNEWIIVFEGEKANKKNKYSSYLFISSEIVRSKIFIFSLKNVLKKTCDN